MTRLSMADITPERLRDFRALGSIPQERCGTLLERAQIERLLPGELLLRARIPADTSLFLLQGELEVTEPAGARHKLYAGGVQARDALGVRLGAGDSMRALDEVSILAIPRQAVEEAAGCPDLQAFTFEYTPVPVPAREDPRDEDWMTRIRKAPLLADFSPQDVQHFFMELERVEYRAGDEILGVGERGDYFYVLFEGRAEVLTDPAGPFAGAVFELLPGSHFGEEALIAGTPRNATVRMKTDGAIGRLARAQFDTIIRAALIQTVDLDKAAGFLGGTGKRHELLDIRFAPEFHNGHRDGARNMPIQLLRKSLGQLAPGATYLVTPEGGLRSQLAVFLLRQAGLGAFLLRD